MKLSRSKFILIFLASAFAFQIATNLILKPVNGDWFPGTNSAIAWERTLASILYPVKFILAGPLPLVFNDPDPAPPIRALACAVYWSVLALFLYYTIRIIKGRKEK